ncbi:hypothetical protein VP01_5197g1 [Puccinia sorghi]|uniref:Uncharacterized protein n=1 Tax=Puccinia sorghi TaxID=27349 RepID=A0A0L6ULH4_9BASI|nr:hypothetical protein VP01_5197g1 [Puccinia sorghi]
MTKSNEDKLTGFEKRLVQHQTKEEKERKKGNRQGRIQFEEVVYFTSVLYSLLYTPMMVPTNYFMVFQAVTSASQHYSLVELAVHQYTSSRSTEVTFWMLDRPIFPEMIPLFVWTFLDWGTSNISSLSFYMSQSFSSCQQLLAALWLIILVYFAKMAGGLAVALWSKAAWQFHNGCHSTTIFKPSIKKKPPLQLISCFDFVFQIRRKHAFDPCIHYDFKHNLGLFKLNEFFFYKCGNLMNRGIILNSKPSLVMKNDDRSVPIITKQSLEVRFSQSKLSNLEQQEFFRSFGSLMSPVIRYLLIGPANLRCWMSTTEIIHYLLI